jgi:histidine triad (HIT) family protein
VFNHAPPDYACPFCRIVKGVEDEHTLTRQSDVVARTDLATAFVSSHWWPNNPGHVLVVPNRHFENIFDLPTDHAAAIHDLSRRVAIAMKTAYRCDGITTRQHSEPAGDQEVWHYHLHVFPRFNEDRFYELQAHRTLSDPSERAAYAKKLREAL